VEGTELGQDACTATGPAEVFGRLEKISKMRHYVFKHRQSSHFLANNFHWIGLFVNKSQSYETFTSVFYEQSADFYELTKMNPMKLFLENYL